MRFSILSLSFLAVAVGTIAAEHPSAKIRSSVRHIDFANLPAAKEPATNAVRLAQGLPPKRPRSRMHGTPVDSAHRAKRSTPPPVQRKCNVLMKTLDKPLGYLSSTFNDYGLLYPIATQENALVVSFSILLGSSIPIDMRSVNGPSAAYPYVGAVIGLTSNRADIGPRNSNFGYIAGTPQLQQPIGSPPAEGDNSLSASTGIPLKYKSAVWVYNTDTQDIRIQWYNPDGSGPQTYLIYAEDLDAIGFTGDPSAVRSSFGLAYPDVTLTCVPVL